MIDVFFAAALIAVVLVTFGWDYIKAIALAIYTWARSKFAWKVQVLAWSEPNPNAVGALFTFTGVEIGPFFIGAVTNQEATVVQPERSRIVQP